MRIGISSKVSDAMMQGYIYGYNNSHRRELTLHTAVKASLT